MLNIRQLKWWVWPCGAVLVGALGLWVYYKPAKAPAPTPAPIRTVKTNSGPAAGSPDSLSILLTHMTTARKAREGNIRRQVDEAIKSAAAGRSQDGLEQIRRLIAVVNADVEAFRQQVPSPQTRPTSAPSVVAERLLSDGRVPHEMLLARLDSRAVDLAKVDVKLAAKEITEQQWASSYGAALDSEPESAGALLERVILYQGDKLTAERMWQLASADLSPMARAVLVEQLWAYHAPGASATVEQCSRFYEGLIARSVDIPAVADGLLDRYIQELDKRDAPEVANRVLEGIICIVPRTRLGARATALRIAVESGAARDKLMQSLRETYAGTDVAGVLQGLYVELLAKENRFIEAFQAMDSDGAMARATTVQQLLQVIAELALRAPSVGAMLCSNRRTALPEASMGLFALSPVQLCLGLAEELTGSQISPTDLDPAARPSTNPSGPLVPAAVLADLLQRATKSLPAESIRQTMLAGIKKAEPLDPAALAASKTAPQRLYEVTWQANFLNTTGKSAEAIAVYRKFIEDFRDNAEILVRARPQFVELLMRQEPLDVQELDKQLGQLSASNAPMTAAVWNLRLRVLLHRIMSVPADARPSIWSGGIAKLAGEGFPLSEEALADVDRLPGRLGRKGAFSPLDILNDLVLLSPNFETMHRLQLRRIGMLLAQGATEDVRQAVAMDLAIASVTAEGPSGVAGRSGEILRFSGVSEDQLKALQTAFRDGLEKPGQAASGTSVGGMDSSLRRAAEAALKAADPGLSLRRKAFLKLLAGQADDAIRHAYALLNQTPASEEALSALDFVAVLLAIADGSFHESNRFAQWLAERNPGQASASTPDRLLAVLQQCESKVSTLIEIEDDVRSGGAADKMPVFQPSMQFDRVPRGLRCELAKAALRRWGQRAVGWGSSLLAAGDTSGARAMWLAAINAQRHRGYASSLLEQVVQNTLVNSSDSNVESRLKLLEEMMPSLRVAQDRTNMQIRLVAVRRQSGLKIAKNLFDEGNYAQCLTSLDELDKRCPEVEGAGDMATGFMRALCLIRLEKLAEASALLAKMESWPGSPEQHARALFLTGWICLQTDEKPKAIGIFRRVAEVYPQTSFAPKAVKLAAGME
jgi:tetratricopeptide (TPR) repeat protein